MPKVSKLSKPSPDTETRKRYIVFVGNLSYKASKEQVEQFFEKRCQVESVRFMTDKVTKKFKGFAFVELKDSDSLRNALRMHHSELEGRKINVEYTAGGGGNTENRKTKIKKKNAELREKEIKEMNEKNEKRLKLAENKD